MSIKELALSSHTHRIQPKKNTLNHFCCIKLSSVFVKSLIFFLNERIKIGENWVILRSQAFKITFICNPPSGI